MPPFVATDIATRFWNEHVTGAEWKDRTEQGRSTLGEYSQRVEVEEIRRKVRMKGRNRSVGIIDTTWWRYCGTGQFIVCQAKAGRHRASLLVAAQARQCPAEMRGKRLDRVCRYFKAKQAVSEGGNRPWSKPLCLLTFRAGITDAKTHRRIIGFSNNSRCANMSLRHLP